MTPATGWSEQDYYRASRAARQAWQNTNQQLEIGGLGEADAASGEASASVSPSRVPSPPDGRDNRRRHPSPPGSKTTTGPDRLSPEDDGQAQRRSR